MSHRRGKKIEVKRERKKGKGRCMGKEGKKGRGGMRKGKRKINCGRIEKDGARKEGQDGK